VFEKGPEFPHAKGLDLSLVAGQLTEFPVGSIVTARNREWIVLPSDDSQLLRLRPLTGRGDDIVGVLPALEPVSPGSFPAIDPNRVGDALSTRLLYDAARLRLRDGAAPFRSIGRYGFTPRPYQFVPLVMALRQEPMRLLIADDVGIGKTIEAGMIARELIDRGIARRIAVVCPAHLCDQWHRELLEKFAIETKVVQPATFARLERALPRQDQSVFGSYQHLVVSIDFVKHRPHRDAFAQSASDLLIVDEAHGAARPHAQAGRSQQLRHDFLRNVVDQNPEINLVLTTATPHSGFESSYRSLLGLLDPEFDRPVEESLDREALVRHLVQRKRGDIKQWLGAETPFPARDQLERDYRLSSAYRKLLDDAIEFCQERVRNEATADVRQRVRLWAAIGLLRCILSSPAAAESALTNRAEARQRAQSADDDTVQAYRDDVLNDLVEEQATDHLPVAALQDQSIVADDAEWNMLLSLVRQAREISGTRADTKLHELAALLRDQLTAEYKPIVFCYYIQTARYLMEELPKLIGSISGAKVRVDRVTGEHSDEEREEIIAELVGESGHRVLIATDCLSEGVNLQDSFDAIVHYDLPWNPNRLEQREGRIDRFGQQKETVQTVILIGADNPVDVTVRDVLIKKAREIRKALGIAVPIPSESESVVQSLIMLMLSDERARGGQMRLGLEPSSVQLGLGLGVEQRSALHQAMDQAAERERRDHAFFSQRGIKPDQVQQELALVDPVLGDGETAHAFLENLLPRFGGTLTQVGSKPVYRISAGELRRIVPEAIEVPERVVFDRMKDPNATYLARTSPFIEALCDAAIADAFSASGDGTFARATAIWTDAVSTRTLLALLRLRYSFREEGKEDQFAEEIAPVALDRVDGLLRPIPPLAERARDLIAQARSRANPALGERQEAVRGALDLLGQSDDWMQPIVEERVRALQESHARLRDLTRLDKRRRTPRLEIELQGQPDLLALAVLIPAGGAR
jgi:superfamily II DNA or RNA helicase